MSEPSLETKFEAQRAMLLALQTVTSYVLAEIAKIDPKLATAIKTGFDNAAMSAEVLAVKEGQSEAGNAGLVGLQIIEELRAITFNK